MPSRVFLDTNGWLALLNASDSLHSAAQRVWSDLGAARHEVCFVVMKEHGIREAFTNDRHFEQAGFGCLLPMP